MTRKSYLAAAVVLTVLLLGGCSASGPVFQPPAPPANSATATLHVFRPDRFVAGGISYTLYIDGREFVSLPNNGFTRIDTDPGSHTIRIARINFLFALTFSDPLALRLDGGETYYVKLHPGFMTARLEQLDPSVALREITASRFVEPFRERY